MTDTTLITCSITALYPHICKHSELNRLIFELLTENYTELCKQIKRLTISDSRQRVASYLADLTETDCAELEIVNHTLPYTQEELAVCLNLHRTTVAKILADFAKKGWVKVGYRKIQVIDSTALREV